MRFTVNMERKLNRRLVWNYAGQSGAVLGLATAVIMFANQYSAQFMSSHNLPAAGLAVSALLWIIKFGGCIWLMRFFMLRLCRRHPEATNSDTMVFGTITALLSALIFATFSLANILFISPDLMEQEFDMVLQSYSKFLDYNTLSQVEDMKRIYPQTAFISTLGYCYLYGTALSAILSRHIPKIDPFADFKKSGQDDTGNKGDKNQLQD